MVSQAAVYLSTMTSGLTATRKRLESVPVPIADPNVSLDRLLRCRSRVGDRRLVAPAHSMTNPERLTPNRVLCGQALSVSKIHLICWRLVERLSYQ